MIAPATSRFFVFRRILYFMKFYFFDDCRTGADVVEGKRVC